MLKQGRKRMLRTTYSNNWSGEPALLAEDILKGTEGSKERGFIYAVLSKTSLPRDVWL